MSRQGSVGLKNEKIGESVEHIEGNKSRQGSVVLQNEKIEEIVNALEHGVKDDHDSLAGINESHLPEYHDKQTQRILRKVDIRLIPMLTTLYVMSFLDRSNLGNAAIAGMEDDLDLQVGHRYNIASMVFFFTYVFFEVPANIMLKTLKPSTWISIMMVSWGIVMTLQGIVQSYHGLIVTRLMLGVCEAGFFPAASYLVTTWYCRFEVQRRMSVFYSASAMAGAFSGILAYGISHMNGVGGLAGWRWIFILEGLLTFVIGASLHWTLPDAPETATFLEPWEKAIIVRRLAEDAGTADGHVDMHDERSKKSILAPFMEPKLYLGMVIWWGNAIPVYGFSFTVPTIIEGLGYTSAASQLLTAPIYIAGVISVIGLSWLADKKQVRWKFITYPYLVSAAGLLALLIIPHPKYPGLTYFFLFFIPIGIYPGLISTCSWMANNLAPSWKRAVGMAFVNSGGNLGGIVGSNIFLDSQAPHYPLGYGFCLATLVVSASGAVLLKIINEKQNAARDRMDVDEIRAKYSDAELQAMGDKSPLYRYVI